ncbi:MAG: TrbM/KikA/MpfK family conjugal transfer protein [Nitrospira sp.]|nr:TrbM/KikA/MpfK family conjugal transfer protein [Nitrospira sp.]
MTWWKQRDWILVLVGVGLLVLAHDATAQTAPKPSLLEGDVRLACECLLCLSAGAQAPKECHTALMKYYLIQGTSPFQTLVKRRNFLQLCPKK